MKVLLVHNFYGSSAPSGENTAFMTESRLLRDYGHTVVEFTRHSDEIRKQGAAGTLRGALSTAWNPFTLKKLRRTIEKEQPDIMHVHNMFPLISPSVFYANNNSLTATVLTLHNYRPFCAAAIPMRGGSPCTECLDKKNVLPALVHGCYRNSRLATLPLAVKITLHRMLRTWQKKVDAFIALTEFQRQKLVEAGLPEDVVYVKPHFYPDPPLPVPWAEREQKAVFIGRLGAEKGISFLIEAWRKWGEDAPVLEIIGDGPEKEKLRKEAGSWGNNKIVFTGQLSFEEVQRHLAAASLLILPSVCYEGFPMVIREAFALGVPVAASRIGSLPFIVDDQENGALFSPGNAEELFNVVKRMWEDRNKLEAMGTKARDKFEREFTAEANYGTLVRIYEQAISRRRGKSDRKV